MDAKTFVGTVPALFIAAVTLFTQTAVGQTLQQTSVPRRLGEVEVLSGPVQCADGNCYEIRVTCPEVAAPARARLKVVAPNSNPPRSTILFTTGGFGFGLYGDGAAESRRTLANLVAAGFRTVQLEWIDSWLVASPGKEEGHVRLGCRPATVARWVHDHLHEPSPAAAFCATGQSGGASQVSYMLSHYGLEEILAAVVPSGGPPMGRIDRGCSGPDDLAYIRNEAMRKLIDTGFGFVPPGDIRTTNPADVPPGPCARGDLSYHEKFREASVASGEGDYFYPHTMVFFVVEGIDSGGAAALGATYYDLLVKSGSPLLGRTVVPGVDHSGLIRTRTGTETIRDVLLRECRIR